MQGKTHACLNIRNISRLPRSLRRLAETIAVGSEPAASELISIISDIQPSDALLFLPALFVNVQTNRVPTPSRLDTIEAMVDVSLAYECLTSIAYMFTYLRSYLPTDAAPALWPHLWSWLDFIHTFWSYLPMSSSTSAGTVCYLHSAIIMGLAEHSDTAVIIRSTPGVRHILAKAWQLVIVEDVLFHGHPEVLVPCLAILCNNLDDEANHLEIVDALGGSLQHLAATLNHHFVRSNSAPKHGGPFIASALEFVRGERGERLVPTLRSAGFVRTLVTTTTTFAAIKEGLICHSAMWLLLLFIRGPAGYCDLALAIEYGFLQAAVKAAVLKDIRADIMDELWSHTLPRHTVHYAVVLQLKSALPKVRALAAKNGFNQCRFWKAFVAFDALASARIGVLDGDWRFIVAARACDNLDCGKVVADSSEIICCGMCRSTHYCSRACQAADWRAGHKNVCLDLRVLRMNDPDELTTRGKSFLRALLTIDYHRYALELAVQQVLCMHENPGVPFATRFVYDGAVNLECASYSDLQEEEQLLPSGVPFADAFVRMARSAGRMELHIVYIFTGVERRPLIFPMRTSNSSLLDGRLRALEQVPEGGWLDEDARIRIEESLRASFADPEGKNEVPIH
ncbi:hypothetical protein C8R46DRAFT_1087524 [Mycena filopes]|nr:hypothetical protein C8R46DRAFT_1087524 [Mycena filopes]